MPIQSGSTNDNINLTRLISELRSINTKIETNSKAISEVQSAVDVVSSSSSNVIPAMINFLDNSDFLYDEGAYNSATFSGFVDSLALWYTKAQGSGAWVKSTTTAQSAQSLVNQSTPTNNGVWNKAAGTVDFGGGYKVGTPLVSKLLTPQAYITVRMDIAKAVGTTISPTAKLKISAWDNSSGQLKIIDGGVKFLNLSRNGTDGGHLRKYILEVTTPAGVFYSNQAPTGITTSALVGTIDPTNFITVSWSEIRGQLRYRLFRQQDATGTYKLIADIVNGSTSFNDKGETSIIDLSAPATQINEQAVAYIDGLGLRLTDNFAELVTAIRIPSDYNYGATTEQWIQVEIIKEDGSSSDTSDAPARSIRIDHIGLSYTNGRWTPSSRDLVRNPVATGGGTPPANPPTGGGGGNPPTGGGYGCVPITSEILAWFSDGWKPVYAAQVKTGMILAALGADGSLVKTTVEMVHHSVQPLCVLHYEDGHTAICSQTQMLITSFSERNSTVEAFLSRTNSTIRVKEEKLVLESPIAITSLGAQRVPVVHFMCSPENPNYIFDGVVAHNSKIRLLEA